MVPLKNLKKMMRRRDLSLPLRMLVVFTILLCTIVIYGIGTELYASFFDPLNGFKEGILACSRASRQSECYDEIAGERLQEKSPQEVLQELNTIQYENARFATLCHGVAHAIGHRIFKKTGTIADAFLACDQTCHAGCYHGAVEAFLHDSMGTSTERHVNTDELKNRITSVCKDLASTNDSFQCFHGLGHAIMFILNYDLPESLSWCELVQNKKDSSLCIGGAFMENITGSMKEKRMVNADPYYPCSVLSEKYTEDCYAMQTTRMIELGLTDGEIAEKCAALANGRGSCFLSLGRDKSVDVRLGKGKEVATLCENLSLTEDTQGCIEGAAFALVDHTWDGSFAFPFCEALQIDENRTHCFNETVDRLLTEREATKTLLIENCSTLAKYRDTCLKTVHETQMTRSPLHML